MQVILISITASLSVYIKLIKSITESSNHNDIKVSKTLFFVCFHASFNKYNFYNVFFKGVFYKCIVLKTILWVITRAVVFIIKYKSASLDNVISKIFGIVKLIHIIIILVNDTAFIYKFRLLWQQGS